MDPNGENLTRDIYSQPTLPSSPMRPAHVNQDSWVGGFQHEAGQTGIRNVPLGWGLQVSMHFYTWQLWAGGWAEASSIWGSLGAEGQPGSRD